MACDNGAPNPPGSVLFSLQLATPFCLTFASKTICTPLSLGAGFVAAIPVSSNQLGGFRTLRLTIGFPNPPPLYVQYFFSDVGCGDPLTVSASDAIEL